MSSILTRPSWQASDHGRWHENTTPSAVKAGFVSAVLDAGYHIELAGGGHYNAVTLRSKVAEIQEKIPAGVGFTLNSLYVNPRRFTFQCPLWQEL